MEYLNRANSHHAYTLQLLKQVYLHLQDWDNLYPLLPYLRKYKVESYKTIDTLKNRNYFSACRRLSRQEKFLGKAKDYLKMSLKLRPSMAAYRELGQIYEEQSQQS